MRRFSSIFFCIPALVAVFLAPAAAMASPESAGFVPAQWILAPETAGSLSPQAEFSPASEKLAKSVDRIFTLQHEALASAPISSLSLPPPADKPKDWVPWRFVAFASDLAVSANGLLGVLSFKGTPSVSVYWQKHEHHEHLANAASIEAEEAVSGRDPVFLLDSRLSSQEVEHEVDNIHRAVLASGRVHDAAVLRDNLAKAVHQFRAMTSSVNATPVAGEWYAQRLRADLEVSASGRVKWGTVGGGVRIRLEWHRAQPAVASLETHKVANGAPDRDGLASLVGALAEDLTAASHSVPAHDFSATSFFVGLGMQVSGNVGIAKGSAQAMGYLYFSRIPPTDRKHSVVAARYAHVPVHLIEAGSKVENLELAKLNGIEAHAGTGMDGQPQTAYTIDRELFRKGLHTAFQIGGFFLDRAKANSGSDWAVIDVKPGFAMSLGGGLGLVTVSGQVTAQLVFHNQAF